MVVMDANDRFWDIALDGGWVMFVVFPKTTISLYQVGRV